MVEQHHDAIVEAYHAKFEATCKEFDLETPISLDEMRKDVKHCGYFLACIMLLFAYDPVCKEKKTYKKFKWLMERAWHYSPELFDEHN